MEWKFGCHDDLCRVMQGWLFQNDEEFWQPPQTKSLLLGVPIGM